ncbi:MAG: hypothetical protein ACREUA_01615 [Burkholderiales bacterium]
MAEHIDVSLPGLLCTSGEPYTYIHEAHVHSLLTNRPSEYYCFVRDELSAIATGYIQLELPPKQMFVDPAGAGDFRVMPCVLRGAGWVRKTVKLVGTNIARQKVPGQVTVGKAFALHPVENYITHIFEGCLLSSARTGICAALAVDLLAPTRTSVAVLGAGRVGYYAAFYGCMLGGVRKLRVADIDAAKAEECVAALSEKVPCIDIKAQPVDKLGSCDVLILATTSTQSVCHPSGHDAGLIVSLGADCDGQSELAEDWARRADIYVDTRDSLRFGDLKLWTAAGVLEPDSVTDLLEVFTHRPPANALRSRIFVSTGSALFDSLTIGYLLSAAGA